MIKSLEIKNYALIRDLNIDLHKGLNIITGETGAGKSILLGALGLIMGKRAELKVLFDPNSGLTSTASTFLTFLKPMISRPILN